MSRVHEKGRREQVTEEAWAELEEAMKEGEIATIAQAHAFLTGRGIIYAGHQLLRPGDITVVNGNIVHEDDAFSGFDEFEVAAKVNALVRRFLEKRPRPEAGG